MRRCAETLHPGAPRIFITSAPLLRYDKRRRARRALKPIGTLMQNEKIKVLLFSANPIYYAGKDKLRTNSEFTGIRDSIVGAEKGGSFEVVFPELAARMLSVQRALRTHQPQIIHFAGHGADEGGIVFEDEIGNPIPADPIALSRLFNVLKESARIIFLNACRTQPSAEALLGISDYTIGTECDIPDKEAIAFSAAFYEGLASGDSVRNAFETATAYLRRGGLDDKVRLNVKDGMNPDETVIPRRRRKVGPKHVKPPDEDKIKEADDFIRRFLSGKS